jgi:integrase
MRSGELQRLQWKHIDRDKMFIRLPKGYTKNKKPRIIPINHHVKTVLDNLTRAITHDYVFTRKGKPFIHRLGFVNQMRNTCRDAGVPYGQKVDNGVVMKDTRRTVKTHMLSAEVGKVYRDLILGHSLKGMDKHYLSPSEDTLTEAMDKFTRWFDSQLENANVDQSVDHKEVVNK